MANTSVARAPAASQGRDRAPHASRPQTPGRFTWPVPGTLVTTGPFFMVDHAALVRAVADYAQALLTHYDIGSVLYRLTDHVTAVLGADGAGVSLADNDHELVFFAATDGDVAAIEEQQILSRQGPCHEAYRTGELVVVTDLEHDERWPAYRPAAVEAGARAVLGVPMPIGNSRIGALDVYRHTRHDWDDAEMEVALALADMASGYVLNAGALERADVLATQLQRALDSRIAIEQAKGILAERHHITPERGVPSTAQPRPGRAQ